MSKLSILEIKKRKKKTDQKKYLRNKQNPEWIENKRKKDRKRNRLKYINKYREIKYKITREMFKEMVDKQNNVCAICGKKGKHELSIDHCHKTNKVRGLLCNKCNCGLGLFNDSEETICKALEYLRKV